MATPRPPKLVTSHLRLVAKIAMGYRGYGLPVGELISEGNVGLMQAVKRFDPDRGFRLATYAMWWIRASIQEYILHSWSLVKMGTTAAQKKLFFNLRRMKSQIQAIEEGDLKPEHVTKIATDLGVTEEEVVKMNRRLAAATPRSTPRSRPRATGSGRTGWSTTRPTRRATLAESQEMGQRKHMLVAALKQLNDRERHILIERRLTDEPKTLEDLSAKLRRQPRARPPDRGARVREAAEGDEEHGGRGGHGIVQEGRGARARLSGAQLR